MSDHAVEGPASPTIRVMIVDDHPVVRHGLGALLATYDDLAVVATAADGETALREAQLVRPDVLLMDVRMPGVDGVEATRRLRTAVPSTAVLVLTMYDDDATVLTAMRAGARGYLLKGAEQEEIVAAIRGVAGGQVIFGPGVASRVLGLFADPSSPVPTDARSRTAPDPFPQLTERERDVLALLADGHRTSVIAERLFLSPKTVSNNLTAIFAKLEVRDRAAAMLRAREGGLGGDRGAS